MEAKYPRFEAYHREGKSGWNVIDHMASKFNMPPNALTMNIGEVSAKKIASLLNEEWIKSQTKHD